MFRLPLCLAALFLLLPSQACPAAAPPPGPLPSQIARWVVELGDDSFAVREAATKKLQAAGSPAEPLLEKAAGSSDAEVARRAKTILAEFRWGIYPDTPENVVELIRKYQSAARSEKRPLIEKLFAAGSAGCRALIKIAPRGAGPSRAQGGLHQPGRLPDPRRAGAAGRGQPRGPGRTLATGARRRCENRRPPLRGVSSPDRTAREAHCRTGDPRKKNPPGKVEAEILAYLYRARGNLVKAAKAAEDAELNELQEAMLYESANWKELDRKPALPDMTSWGRYVGSRAAYARLAGDRKIFEKAVADLIDRARPLADSKGDVLPFAKALFLNARPNEALALLKKADGHPRLRFEVLAAQLNLKEAFEIVETARKTASPHLPGLEIVQARVLYSRGEKDRALAILKRYAEKIKKGADVSWARDLVEVELQIDRPDEAFAHAAKVLVISDDSSWPPRLFAKLFPDQESEAAALWGLFRRVAPKQPADKALARLRALLEGKAAAREVDALTADAAREPPLPVASFRREEWLAAGEAARRCKQTLQAIECFRKAGSARALLRWGDLLAEKKQWPQAAARYLDAFRLTTKTLPGDEAADREDAVSLPALALYLHGRALVHAGQTALGNKRIEQAHLLPLGSGEVRQAFARELLRRNHREDARREHDLLRRLGEPLLADPNAIYTCEGLQAAALEAAKRKDYLKAADGFEQAFLRCLHPELNFARYPAYVTVPAQIHRLRTHGLLAAGKFEEARTEAQRARAAIPGSVDLVLDLIPLFDQHGKKKDADELFNAVFALYEGVVKDYPRDATSYNQAAWLSACCRRNLDRGLLHARKAVAAARTRPLISIRWRRCCSSPVRRTRRSPCRKRPSPWPPAGSISASS